MDRHIDDERRVWYMMLQIGTPVPTYGVDPTRHIRLVQRELKTLRIVKIRCVSLEYGSDSNFNERYLFRFTRYKRNDAAATRLAEAFAYGMSLVHGPMLENHHDSLLMRVPGSMLDSAASVRLEDLVKIEHSRPPTDRSLTFPETTLCSVSSTTSDRHEAAWRIAALTFNDEALFDATRFLKRSHDNFFVNPGQIREVASDKEAEPLTHSHQTDFEDALQNAFKAIEAVIGDPPRDDRKFFAKLSAIGVDPAEEVGYEDKVAISTVIRKMNEARDKRSAHGSTRKRTIRPSELLDFQACSEVIVMAALESARGSPLFP